MLSRLKFYINSLKVLRKIINFLNNIGLLKLVPDKLFLKILFKIKTNNKLNLNKPKTFNEKMQWLKLYDRKNKYTILADKYRVRKYVEEKIGSRYLIPLIGVYEYFNEISFNKLPNKFVIKTTHDSGGVVICEDKEEIDLMKVKTKINRSLKRNYYYYWREWCYKNIQPKIIIEEFIYDKHINKAGLVDFKFYCFNGKPYYCQVIQNRGRNETIDFFDMDWKRMPFNGTRPLPMSENPIKRPKKLNEMIEISERLSENIPFLRVDLYYVNNQIYFGELTFFPSSGFGSFYPKRWNRKIGDLIELPSKSSNKQTER